MEVVPADPGRLDDVLAVIGGGHEHGCLCQYWRMTSGEYSRSSYEKRVVALRAQLADTPPAGMLAYVGGEPAGWLGFAPRQRAGRLVRSRTIPRVDDLPVWSLFCFTVRPGYRRQGVAGGPAPRADRLRARAGRAGAGGLSGRHGRPPHPRHGRVRRHAGAVRGGRLPSRARDRRPQRAPAALAHAPGAPVAAARGASISRKAGLTRP